MATHSLSFFGCIDASGGVWKVQDDNKLIHTNPDWKFDEKCLLTWVIDSSYNSKILHCVSMKKKIYKCLASDVYVWEFRNALAFFFKTIRSVSETPFNRTNDGKEFGNCSMTYAQS